MVARAGEIAEKTHVFHCARCRCTVSVKQGEVIPRCPNGHSEFKKRMQEQHRTPRPT
jgi:hypothetical protein